MSIDYQTWLYKHMSEGGTYVDAKTFAELHDTTETEILKSRGLGDTFAKIIHVTGADKLAQLYTNVTGKDCGCNKRIDTLNKWMPYE